MLCLDLSLKIQKLKSFTTKHSSAIKTIMLLNFHLWNWDLWTMKNGVGNKGAFINLMILVLSTAVPQWQYNGNYLGYTAFFLSGIACLICSKITWVSLWLRFPPYWLTQVTLLSMSPPTPYQVLDELPFRSPVKGFSQKPYQLYSRQRPSISRAIPHTSHNLETQYSVCTANSKWASYHQQCHQQLWLLLSCKERVGGPGSDLLSPQSEVQHSRGTGLPPQQAHLAHRQGCPFVHIKGSPSLWLLFIEATS